MTYDNIKSHKKAGFHPFFRRYIFRKTTGGTPPPPHPPAVAGLNTVVYETSLSVL